MARVRWRLGVAAVAAAVALAVIGLRVGLADVPAVRSLWGLYGSPGHLHARLRAWGAWAPVVFIVLQALQVVVAPVPGEITGFLGGFVFGQWGGLVYSMLGLSLGSFLAFAVGRGLGAAFVQRLVSPEIWRRLGFIVEAEGAIFCFVLYLVPGFPQDLLCYLFGLSPMPFWVFALTSTLGRLPGTWMLSAQGAKTASGQYVAIALLAALVAALGLPLYYARHQILARVRHARVSRP